MSLTDEEKVRIRHHAGYPNAATVSTSILGMPATIETSYLIEVAMNNIRPEAEYQVRRHLQILDSIESQMVDDLELLAVTQVDTITVRQDEQTKLTVSYDRWVDSMCNLLAIERNPYDQRLGSGGINVRVQN